jgi:hypothetical protein
VNTEEIAEGRGRSKRLAERAAARLAISAGYDHRQAVPSVSPEEERCARHAAGGSRPWSPVSR